MYLPLMNLNPQNLMSIYDSHGTFDEPSYRQKILTFALPSEAMQESFQEWIYICRCLISTNVIHV